MRTSLPPCVAFAVSLLLAGSARAQIESSGSYGDSVGGPLDSYLNRIKDDERRDPCYYCPLA